MDFKFCRNKNKGIVMSFMKSSRKKLADKLPICEATCFSHSTFELMYVLARMRKTANEYDMGFGGFLVTDDDRYYHIVSTLNESEIDL